MAPRRAGASLLREAGFRLPVIVHRAASVAVSAELEEGVQVMAGAIVGRGCADGTRRAGERRRDRGPRRARWVSACTWPPAPGWPATRRVGDGAHIGTGAIVIQGSARSAPAPSWAPARWCWMTSPGRGARGRGPRAAPRPAGVVGERAWLTCTSTSGPRSCWRSSRAARGRRGCAAPARAGCCASPASRSGPSIPPTTTPTGGRAGRARRRRPAVVALSSPLGIEALPADEAARCSPPTTSGACALPAGLRGLGAARPRRARSGAPGRALLDAGLVGLCLPAGALSGPAGCGACAPLLWSARGARGRRSSCIPARRRGARHAGAGSDVVAGADRYVAQMHAAWLGVRAPGSRPAHPRLRVVLRHAGGPRAAAGRAPRLARRPAVTRRTPLAFYDTSSYGPRAVAAWRPRSGPTALVHGSDRRSSAPANPRRPRATTSRRPRGNPARLLAPRRCARDRTDRSPSSPDATWRRRSCARSSTGSPPAPSSGPARAPRRRRADLRAAAARRPGRGVADLLERRGPRHRLPRPRHLQRGVRRRGGAAAWRSGWRSGAPIRRRAAARPVPVVRRPRTSTACTASADGPAVSLHAYSPPLVRMGVYGVAETGPSSARASAPPTS